MLIFIMLSQVKAIFALAAGPAHAATGSAPAPDCIVAQEALTRMKSLIEEFFLSRVKYTVSALTCPARSVWFPNL